MGGGATLLGMASDPTELRDVTLPNGVRVVVEPMPWLATTSAVLQLPFGTVGDPDGARGAALVLHEWLQRGAGGRDARQQADAFDRFGVRRGGGCGRETATLSAAFLAQDVAEVLPLLADAVRAPALLDDEFAGARALALQELAGLDDAPAQRLGESVVRARYASAHGRSAYGDREELEALTPDALRGDAGARLGPAGAVLALAGGGDPDRLLDVARRAFEGWTGATRPRPTPDVRPAHRAHVDGPGAQTQIGVTDDAVAPGGDGWTEQALAMAVLSGAMGARLPTEVRERRGLVYTVASSVRSVRGDAYRFTYASTTPERAAETIDVVLSRARSVARRGRSRRARARADAAAVQPGHAGRIERWPRVPARRGRGGIRATPSAARGRGDARRNRPARGQRVPRDAPGARAHDRHLGSRAPGPGGGRVSAAAFDHVVLPNGMQVLGERSPARSVAVGAMVDAGARDEAAADAGVSHFLEHLAFKGDGSRDAIALNRAFDALGARYNAFTSHERTFYYGAVLPEAASELTDLVLSLLRPALAEDDVEVERKVVLEEIAMYFDRPASRAFERSSERFFAGHPLGASILGTTATVGSLTADRVRAVPRRAVRRRQGRRGRDRCVRLAAARRARRPRDRGLASDRARRGRTRRWRRGAASRRSASTASRGRT